MKRRRSSFPFRCRRCRLQRLEDEKFYNGLCSACRELLRRNRRQATGQRILAKAEDAGTAERDGQTYRLVLLPPKRRGA